jgi:hypothetical protein
MGDEPNQRRALVLGAADAAYWDMQRTLVVASGAEILYEQGHPLWGVRAIYLADHGRIGKEAAAHLRVWMQELGCTPTETAEITSRRQSRGPLCHRHSSSFERAKFACVSSLWSSPLITSFLRFQAALFRHSRPASRRLGWLAAPEAWSTVACWCSCTAFAGAPEGTGSRQVHS